MTHSESVELGQSIHIIEGVDWKDAIIALLEPNSSYRPWRYAFGPARGGDLVAVILNTEPASILTVLGTVRDNEVSAACLNLDHHMRPNLLDLTTLVAILGFERDEDPQRNWIIRGSAATRLSSALIESGSQCDVGDTFGHSALAAARLLLRSQGQCDGCDTFPNLRGDDARHRLLVHTVDAPERPAPDPPLRRHPEPPPIELPATTTGSSDTKRRSTTYKAYGADSITFTKLLTPIQADWPAVLCDGCSRRMRDGGFESFVEYRVSTHPSCPQCGMRRARKAIFGLLGYAGTQAVPPWREARGCVDSDEIWSCSECGHVW